MKTCHRFVPIILLVASLVVGGAGCSREAKRDRHLKRADRYFGSEQYTKAEIEYLNVLKAAPLHPAAIRQLGLLYYNQGRLRQAFAYLRKAVELDPQNAEVRLKLGVTYMSARQLKEARMEALWILERQPANEEALLLLADTGSSPKEIQEIQQRIEKLREKDKDRAGYHLAAGWLYLRQQESDQADGEFKKAFALHPNSSAVHLALGTLHWVRNDLKQADQAIKTASELAPFRSAMRLKYVDFKLKTGAVEEAKKLLEEITRKVPDYLPPWTYLMQVAFAESKYDDCAVLIKKILARDLANYDAMLFSGRLRLARGEVAQAIAEFERMSTIYGSVPQVKYQLARAQLLTNEVAKAIGTLNQAMTLDPNFSDAILLLAELNIRTGNSAPAITSLTQLIKQQPQIARAHLLLATAYLTQKNLDETVAVYRRMMGLFPDNPEIPLLMGIALAKQNKRAEARKAFEKSLELSPHYLPAFEQLLNLDLVEKQYTAAFARVEKEMEKNPSVAETHLLLASIHAAQALERTRKELEKNPSATASNILLALNSAESRLLLARLPMAQRDLAQAEAALLKAIELKPNLGTAYRFLAEVYVALNKHQPALERLTGLVGKTNDVSALMQIGVIHEELKNFAEARNAYEKLLSVNPRFSLALNNLAYLYSERFGLLDKAYEMAEKARQLLPYEPHTADTLGWILYQRGEYPRAIGLLQESAGKLPAEPEIQFHLGMTHYMMGEEEPARVALQRAAQANSNFPGREEAGRRLAFLAIDVKTASGETLASLEKRMREEPNDTVASKLLAAIYERNGAFDKAVQTYEKALKQNPKNARMTASLAQLYSSHLNDRRKALELAKDAHNLAPEDPYISRTLGSLVYEAGDFKWAASLLQESASKLPHDPGLLYDLAWSYYSVGRVGEAESTMRSALQNGATFNKLDDAKRFLEMITACTNTTQAQAAAPQAQKILDADPRYVPALMVSALLQEQRGGYKEARQLYEKALDRYPLFSPATRQLAVLYAERLGDDQKAYELALKAREAFPEDPQLAGTLGILAYRRGNYARSAQLLKESARARSDDAELLYYLGMAHYKLKEQRESKDALQRALALNVQTKFADEARRVIGELK